LQDTNWFPACLALQAEKDCEALRAEINRVAAAAAEQEAAMNSQRAEVRQLQNVIAEVDQVRWLGEILGCRNNVGLLVCCRRATALARTGRWWLVGASPVVGASPDSILFLRQIGRCCWLAVRGALVGCKRGPNPAMFAVLLWLL
jgi:hypothetical protein